MASAPDVPRLHLSRRQTLLLGAGAAMVAVLGSAASCTDGDHGGPDGSDSNQPRRDPDLSQLAGAKNSLDSLIAAYTATGRAHPSTAERLAPLRAIHERHAATVSHAAGQAARGPLDPKALRPRKAEDRSSSTSEPTPGSTDTEPGTASPSANTTPPAPPGNKSDAIKALATLEQTNAKTRRTELGLVESGKVARLLASIAAAHEVHAAYLESGAGDG